MAAMRPPQAKAGRSIVRKEYTLPRTFVDAGPAIDCVPISTHWRLRWDYDHLMTPSQAQRRTAARLGLDGFVFSIYGPAPQLISRTMNPAEEARWEVALEWF